MEPAIILPLAILVFVLVTVGKGVRQVPQGNKWVVQRLGKYHCSLNPGLNFLVPCI
jgi:regulator of protease activity HflC (stomatin/prohibitin superfamily)